ncbi:hypothetical protein SAMN04487895_101719 [Paenibacillus sophorae]|uniref:Motility quorum-sensing regulator, toxin of MqsA n=1 Tax=Paenibacillus sophorae TaxID=1333845 RepID=A0A1H8H103_9BACL|nr:hypothetical protein [Paenibacillus sophorae]QWU14409.1 hypothetical protein KP014_21105 [Paenibacillus sophorae]SEN49916.1 hypothetical protein SAMN04487895_101719 [Paenibacillus sophorae]
MFKPEQPVKPINMKLSNEEVILLINELYPKFFIHYSYHVKMRLAQPDRNFTEQKLLSILKRPKHVEPKWNDEYYNYTYLLEGYNKRHLAIAFRVDNNNKLYIECVTVF